MKNTYSFEGQDMISSSILRQIKKGTYIDIGSNHPIKNNDTYYFYKSGWEGIIIEPNKKFNSLYKKYRPKDCHKNFLIFIKKNYKFFFFKDNTLSTSDIKTIKRYKKK